MSSNWPIASITEIVDFNPPRKIKKGDIAPFVDMAALPTSAKEIEEIGTREFIGSGSKFKNGDTLFARITPCLENGKTAKVSSLNENESAHGSTEFIVMAAKDKEHDEDFVYYIARHPEFRAFARARMEGTSGRQRVSWQSLTEFEIPLPPKEVRKAIGDILSRFDEKINSNQQINRTLEQMAQAIFKSWFVDFDPVRAKMEGRQPEGMDAETAALFPDEFEESELGLMPKGWRLSNIGNEFDVTMGQSPPGDTYNQTGEGICFFQGRTDFGWRYPVNRIYCTAPTRLAKKGDTLLSVRAPVGDVNKAVSDCCIGRGISAIRHKSGCEAYTYYVLKNLAVSFVSFNSEGTVFGSINQKDLKSLRVIVPSIAVLKNYSSMVAPIDEKIRVLEEEIVTLASNRDLLLPKLLSGELTANEKIQ